MATLTSATAAPGLFCRTSFRIPSPSCVGVSLRAAALPQLPRPQASEARRAPCPAARASASGSQGPTEDDSASAPAPETASPSSPAPPSPAAPAPAASSSALSPSSLRSSAGAGSRSSSSSGAAGDPASRDVLDAFFLGRALAEVALEKVGTVVGELLSDISRAQAEQQQQVREFQDEVKARAQAAQEKARKL